MICPHCEYEHGWNYEREENVIGKKELFYTLPVEMKRTHTYGSVTEREIIYACPSCGKTFIEV